MSAFTLIIAVLPNTAEPLSIAIKLRELAALGETCANLRSTFQACMVVIGERVGLYCRHCRLVRMSASTNRLFVRLFVYLFVPAKAALCTT